MGGFPLNCMRTAQLHVVGRMSCVVDRALSRYRNERPRSVAIIDV